MRKKFVKVMLFGALTFAVAASFVGCKDYDDDIKNLQGQVDQAIKDLSELKASVGSLVKSVTYNAETGDLIVVGTDGKSVSTKISSKLPTYSLAITTDGKLTLTGTDGTKSEVTITFPDAPVVPEFDATKLTVDANGVVMYDGKATGVTLPKSTTGSITEIKNGDVVIGYTIQMNDQTATFSVIDAVPLKGMVFEPQAYLSGIPAMKATTLKYNEWTANAYTKATLTGEIWKQAATASYINPKVVAFYNLNPSSVTNTQIKSLKFKFDDKLFVGTRSAEFNPTVESSEMQTVDGQPMLKVIVNVTSNMIQAIDADKVSVLALQATINVDGKGDKVITSDYAAIYKSIMTNFVLANNKLDATVGNPTYRKHLYGADNTNNMIGLAQEAIDALPTYEVDLKGTFDLKTVVETHFDEVSDAATPKVIVKDAKLSDELLKAYGLDYKFTASNYITGGNATPQNEFFSLVDGVVTPKVYGTEGPAATGRMPLVRVELIETATGKTLNAGWIKLAITKKIDALPETYTFDSFNLACGTVSNKIPVEFMNVNIYNTLKLTKAEFHELYKLDKNGNEAVLASGENLYGKVTELIDPNPNNETSVVEWVLDQEKVYNSTSNEFTATITYKPIDPSRGNVVIVMKTKVIRPTGAISDENKINEYWDASKTYVRLNVETPGTGATCSFVTDLDNAFVGNKIVVSNVPAGFDSFASEKLSYKFIFAKGTGALAKTNAGRKVTDNNGTVRTLSVSPDGFSLYADGLNLVATIDENTHNVTFAQTDIAKALLNIEAHNENPFFAYIDVVVTNECDMQLPLTNEIFEAKFLRPVNVFKNKDGKFIDAKDNGSTVELLDLVYLTDWRDAKFSENNSYYTYYDIKSIEIDMTTGKHITSSLNGDNFKTPLNEITSQISLTPSYKQDKTTPDYGTITYKNNGNAVGAFQLKIPVVVTYKWGRVTTDIIVNVEQTQGN